ncbi:pilus assembly protein TadG-related protein [Nocardiopsis composta]|uniref:Putative Flp pilus-assembly TadG-like N-terminal domain-containing protein n=1 Tax=Nocardiopsis composta TaxID=157465 RepID=A0A7W8QGB5_9ACTN|nr:hypothetical protein [Nocardiopsis composta]
MPHRRSEGGQVTAFTLTTALALLSVFALVWEGGAALAARARALHLAQEAARAGAQHIDLAAYRAGEDVVLEPAAAQRAAQDFLHRAGADGEARADGESITVIARLDHAFVLLPLGTRSLAATATAAPHTAPEGGP